MMLLSINMLARKLVILLLAFAYFGTTAIHSADYVIWMKPGDELTYNTKPLCSSSGRFCIDFNEFPAHSRNFYLVVFDTATDQIVWTANRNKPFDSNQFALSLDFSGELKILSQPAGNTLITLFSPAQGTNNTSLSLWDSGNFVLEERLPDGTRMSLWQSFDYPTDTLLPEMKLGVNHKTGQTWSLVSYLTDSNPALGAFTLEWEPKTRQLIIRQRAQVYWASGVLRNNQSLFEYISEEAQKSYEYGIVSNEDEEYFTYSDPSDVYLRLTMSYSGQLIDGEGNAIASADTCYGYNTDGGCQTWELPACRHVDETFELVNAKLSLSDTNISVDSNSSFSESDCKAICWSNCSCYGYMNAYDRSTRYCYFYNYKGMNWENITDDCCSNYPFKMLVRKSSEQHDSTEKWIRLGAVIVTVIFICCACILWLARRRRKLVLEEKKRTMMENNLMFDLVTHFGSEDMKELQNNKKNRHYLRVFSYASVVAATNGFSSENKLGQGGFGPVYKGKLQMGKEVAVKRLSRTSGQGVTEFKNELRFISELQHMNLVQLLGCCIDGEERILIYEYMPNKSLDFFLFDSIRSKLLNWKERFNIMEGITQGLLYLHKYSRLRVIHRDLKASNILLDENLNLKISDFGMARIFTQESEANTIRIVGTYGYMSPEYAMEGVFSVKSDVYSFGVLMLEIVSGRKNNSFYDANRQLNLVGHAWELWKEGVALELIDPAIDSFVEDQVLRCIHLGLLCVEECAADRPIMSEVLSMLTNESARLSVPKRPAFYFGRRVNDKPESPGPILESINGLSISDVSPR